MRRVKGVLMPPDREEDFLDLAPELGDIADFDFFPIMNKDSTNISHRDWTIISTEIYERARSNKYTGVVVAHGTDTMHFTASAVTFALGANLNFPVVFTGAQTSPEVQHGDARVNLIRAFKVCLTDLAEVAISFGDYVFRGCRAQKKDERRFDAFESPSYYPIAYITEEILLTGLARRIQQKSEAINFLPYFSDGIVQFSLIPGLEPKLIEIAVKSQQCKGIILQSFGAGNVPSKGEYSLIPVIELATSLGKPTIVTSQFAAGATFYTQYETGVKAEVAGAISTGNMTSSCAAAKFRWVLANVDRDIRAAQNRLGEIRRRMQSVFIDEMDELQPKEKTEGTPIVSSP